MIAIVPQLRDYPVDRAGILRRQTASQGISQQLSREISYKQILALEQRRLQALRSCHHGPVRQFATVVDRLPRILIPPAPDEVVVFECESKRIDAAVAAGAGWVGAMLRKHLANRFRLGGR